MRIVIIALGSRGDVQPCIVLARGLQDAGHTVLLASHANFAPLVSDYNIHFFPLSGDTHAALTGEAGQAFTNSGRNLLRFMREFMRASGLLLEQLQDEVLQAVQGADLMISTTLAYFCEYISQKTGIPNIIAHLQPNVRTRAFPCPAVAGLSLGKTYNYLTYILAEQLFWQLSRPVANRLRQRLQLPPYPLTGPYKQFYKRHPTIFCAFSPFVVPRPADWGAEVHETGYWSLDPPAQWQPSPALTTFLEAGPPPVYVGFGSMSGRNASEVTNIVVQALTLTKQRGIILTGWGGLSSSDLPDSIIKLEDAPHNWLFPRMAALVHHGGAGTTASGLRAGVPGILIPFFGDQFFWGQRIQALGVGPRPIPYKQLTAQKLASALRQAIEDSQMRASAARMGTQIRSEDGVARAVSVIEQL